MERDLRITCNNLSKGSWLSLRWDALNLVNQVLYSKAEIIGTKSFWSKWSKSLKFNSLVSWERYIVSTSYKWNSLKKNSIT